MRGSAALLSLLWLALASLALASLAPIARAHAQPAPAWAPAIADSYVGREWNGGHMDCARTEFALRDGVLTGHYWIGDSDPFEGDLTGFQPEDGQSGLFTWTDRYGQGVIYVRFAEDGQSFYSLWGETAPDPHRPGYGLRGPDARIPGCASAPTS